MEDRKVYYDKKHNGFFGVINKYPRSYLVTGVHAFYSTAKTGDTLRYNIPKSYIRDCVLVENESNIFSEMDKYQIGYVAKGRRDSDSFFIDMDKTIFKRNEYQHKIAQYRWDKQNNFWKDFDLLDSIDIDDMEG